ncbi:MAG: T9SS type A sorting domain-containing protein [Candidatus Neomarinimicrobiota bacterium]
MLNVYDLSGRCVLQRNISGPQQTLDIRSLPQGMYIMTLTRPGTAELLKMKYVKL